MHLNITGGFIYFVLNPEIGPHFSLFLLIPDLDGEEFIYCESTYPIIYSDENFILVSLTRAISIGWRPLNIWSNGHSYRQTFIIGPFLLMYNFYQCFYCYHLTIFDRT